MPSTTQRYPATPIVVGDISGMTPLPRNSHGHCCRSWLNSHHLSPGNKSDAVILHEDLSASLKGSRCRAVTSRGLKTKFAFNDLDLTGYPI